LIAFIVLVKKLLTKLEDIAGHAGECPELFPWFAEAGLAFRLGSGDFTWDGLDLKGSMMRDLAFCLSS
jgi:hypothetical protein